MCATGTYIDKKCPFTSNVSIRGRILSGKCMHKETSAALIVLSKSTLSEFYGIKLPLMLFPCIVLQV